MSSPVRAFALFLTLPFLTACSGTGLVMPPLLSPAAAASDPAVAQRRGALELHVKTNHGRIMDELATGGPALDRAMEIAGVPPADRDARRLQMLGDSGAYAANPGAMVLAFMTFGRPA